MERGRHALRRPLRQQTLQRPQSLGSTLRRPRSQDVAHWEAVVASLRPDRQQAAEETCEIDQLDKCSPNLCSGGSFGSTSPPLSNGIRNSVPQERRQASSTGNHRNKGATPRIGSKRAETSPMRTRERLRELSPQRPSATVRSQSSSAPGMSSPMSGSRNSSRGLATSHRLFKLSARRQQMQEERRAIAEQLQVAKEMRECTFRPQTNNTEYSPMIRVVFDSGERGSISSASALHRSSSTSSLYDRGVRAKQQKAVKAEEAKIEQVTRELSECTFQPAVHKDCRVRSRSLPRPFLAPREEAEISTTIATSANTSPSVIPARSMEKLSAAVTNMLEDWEGNGASRVWYQSTFLRDVPSRQRANSFAPMSRNEAYEMSPSTHAPSENERSCVSRHDVGMQRLTSSRSPCSGSFATLTPSSNLDGSPDEKVVISPPKSRNAASSVLRPCGRKIRSAPQDNSQSKVDAGLSTANAETKVLVLLAGWKSKTGPVRASVAPGRLGG